METSKRKEREMEKTIYGYAVWSWELGGKYLGTWRPNSHRNGLFVDMNRTFNSHQEVFSYFKSCIESNLEP